MRRLCECRGRRSIVLSVTMALTIALPFSGCGSSGVVEGELSGDARKALFQKKMDVQQRPLRKAKSSAKTPPRSLPPG